MESKRIQKIEIKGLFGYLNHEIELKEPVTILHGLNGTGKTTTLDILYALFGDKAFYKRWLVDNASFSELTIVFNDVLTTLFLKKELGFIDGKLLFNNSTSEVSTEYKLYNPNTDEVFTTRNKEEINNKDYIIKNKQLTLSNSDFYQLRKIINIYYFSIKRLYIIEQDPYGEFVEKATVQINAEKLSRQIKNKLSELANLSQTLDREFTTKLLENTSSQTKDKSAIIAAFKELEEKRLLLMDYGILDKDEHFSRISQEKLNDIDENKLNILELNLQDTRKKLAIFKDLEEKAGLFLNIINKKFQYSYKKLILDKEKGLKVITKAGDEIAVTDLSTGEQHEIVFIYGLLFETEENALILIDEPELSLHPSWQRDFVDDLKAIAAVSNIYFIIATHSPQIINNNFDLMVELKPE